MKFTTTVLALLAAATSVVAIDYSGIPTCALTCIVQAIGSSGCSATDFQCQCVTNQQKITDAATPCIVSACSTEDQAKVSPAVSSLCAEALSTSLPAATGSATGTVAAKSATITSAASGTAASAAAAATSSGTAADGRGMGAAVLGVAAMVMAI